MHANTSIDILKKDKSNFLFYVVTKVIMRGYIIAIEFRETRVIFYI